MPPSCRHLNLEFWVKAGEKHQQTARSQGEGHRWLWAGAVACARSGEVRSHLHKQLFTQNTTYQGRHLFLPCAQACQQASLPKFWSPECALHLAVMQLTRPSPQPGVPERASPVWESGHRVPPNAWRNDGAVPFCLVL